MKKLFMAVCLSVFASCAQAEQFLCEFDKWNGPSKSIAISWTGEKVFIDTAQGLAQRGFSDGWYEAQTLSKISKAANFTTYSVQSQESDDSGGTYFVTFSFRVYADGRGTARINPGSRVSSITASGTCTKG